MGNINYKVSTISSRICANDLDGTIEKESIQSAAGASSSNGMKVDTLVALIKNSGFKAVERDSIYNEVKAW